MRPFSHKLLILRTNAAPIYAMLKPDGIFLPGLLPTIDGTAIQFMQAYAQAVDIYSHGPCREVILGCSGSEFVEDMGTHRDAPSQLALFGQSVATFWRCPLNRFPFKLDAERTAARPLDSFASIVPFAMEKQRRSMSAHINRFEGSERLEHVLGGPIFNEGGGTLDATRNFSTYLGEMLRSEGVADPIRGIDHP